MFLTRRKPTSPALRWEATTTNKFYKRCGNKKLLPSRTYRGFEDKKTKRKSTNRPSKKIYKLQKHFSLLTDRSCVLSLHKNTGVNYLTACISTGGGMYYIKAPCGLLVNTNIPQRKYSLHGGSFFLLGDRLGLGVIPTGGICYSLKIATSNKWSIAESAGTFCKILWHDDDGLTAMNIPSKRFIKLSTRSVCNAGRVSNQFHNYTVLGNARGARSKKGRVISVRGVAMNPVDHPNGGRSNTKQPLMNPWGKIAKKGK